MHFSKSWRLLSYTSSHFVSCAYHPCMHVRPKNISWPKKDCILARFRQAAKNNGNPNRKPKSRKKTELRLCLQLISLVRYPRLVENRLVTELSPIGSKTGKIRRSLTENGRKWSRLVEIGQIWPTSSQYVQLQIVFPFFFMSITVSMSFQQTKLL